MFVFETNSRVKIKISDEWLKRAVSAVSRLSGRRGRPYFSLAFIGPAEMNKINAAYRGKNQATDVLSFVSDAAEQKQGELGEILICPAVARRQAKEFSVSFDQEIARLLIHGLAHLLGYEHENASPRTEKKMKFFEEKCREKLGFYGD